MSTMAKSCDTFVALPPATAKGYVVFGKNSDRPCAEVQEVIHVPGTDHAPGSKLQCTYIEIDQVAHTHAVVLSKPAWMWGAEMGANEHGVTIGNEAVWNKLNGPEDAVERLLGMDLLRLALERGSTAQEAMLVITQLLATHGQGGNCADDMPMTYHNSFIIADQSTAWVLETAGHCWAAEHVQSGVRNISNELTIGTKIDAMSPGLKEFAESKGFWSPGVGDFHFAKVFSDSVSEIDLDNPCSRQQWGTKLLKDFSKEGGFSTADMFKILRHKESGICMEGAFVSAGSQVSVLTPSGSSAPCCHWFTSTPNPTRSIFKPFLFCPGASLGDLTQSPTYGDEDPAKSHPRFQKVVDREHALYKAHKYLCGLLDNQDKGGEEILENMKELERNCVGDMDEILEKYDEKTSAVRVAAIFHHMSELELNFYKMGGYK